MTLKDVLVASLLVALLLCAVSALAHDAKRPDLDDWYGGLKRPGVKNGFNGCCSLKDCHPTDAELRGGEWWAKVGLRNKYGEWKLLDPAVRVPANVVLSNHDNPTGEGVICHSTAWANSEDNRQVLDPARIDIWCFVPPAES